MARGRAFAVCLVATSLIILTACAADEEGAKATSGSGGATGAEETATPTASPESTPTREPLPTPNQSGIYEDLTLEQAQEMMPFDVLVPGEVPSAFELSSITAESETLQTGLGDPSAVQFWFSPVEGDPRNVVEVSQHVGTVFLGSGGERSQLRIAGVEVTRVILPEHDNGQRMVAYNWGTDEYSVSVSGMTGAGIETDDLEELIRSLLEH